MLDEIPTVIKQQEILNKKAEPLADIFNALGILAGTRSIEIDLPVLKVSCIVKPVNGSEELRLRTMKASGAAFIRSFNKVIYEHTTFKGMDFEDFEDFQNHLTPPDKAMLVYALLDATFAKLPEKIITCPSCGNTDTYEFEPHSMVHSDTISKIWDKKLDHKDYQVVSEIVPGFTIHYHMPDESTRIKIIQEKENQEMREELENTNEVLSQMELFSLYVKQLDIVVDGKVKELTDIVGEILPVLINMPMELKTKLLNDETIKEFIEYSPKFYFNIPCTAPACTLGEFKWDDISPEQDFFLKALSVYN